MHTTSRLALDVVDGTDNVSSFPTVNIQQMGVLDTAALYQEGTLANRPSAGTLPHGTFYRATDTGDLSYTNGNTWISVAQVGIGPSTPALYQQGTLANRPAAGAVPAGTLYDASDTGMLAWTNGNAWTPLGLTAVTAAQNMTASIGTLINAVPSSTITLPQPVTGAMIGIMAYASTTGTNPVTIQYGAGRGTIYGTGLLGANNHASSFLLGTPVAPVILFSPEGVNWNIISGQQDTGWVPLTLASGVSESGPPSGAPAEARLRGDTVEVRGNLGYGSGSTTNWATLPSQMRPGFQFHAVGLGGFQPATIVVATSGLISTQNVQASLEFDITFSLSY